MDKVLVTGGCGFIGSHIVEHLGKKCVVLDNLSNSTEENQCYVRCSCDNLIYGDVRDETTVRQAVKGCDTVFHLAAISNFGECLHNPQLAHDVNVEGTHIVMDACADANRKLVLAGSAAVYGFLNPYAMTKLLAEQMIVGQTLRMFNVYGPRQNPDSPYSGVISKFIKAALNDEPLIVAHNGLQTRDFIHVDDVVKAYIMFAGGSYTTDIGTGVETNVSSLANMIVDMCRSKSEIINDYKMDPGISRSCAKLVNGIWRPNISLKDGLKDTIKSEKKKVGL